jgi:hypothetical protein
MDDGLRTERKILVRNLGQLNHGLRGQNKCFCISIRFGAFKPSGPVVEPDDHVLRVKKIGPNQVIVAVVVDVTGKQCSGCVRLHVKIKNAVRLCLTEAYVDAFVPAGAAKSRVIDAVVAVKIRECEGLSVTEEAVLFRKLWASRRREGADTACRCCQNYDLDQRYVLQKRAALPH